MRNLLLFIIFSFSLADSASAQISRADSEKMATFCIKACKKCKNSIPDLEVKSTIEGIRLGRDEVLEKALEVANSLKE